VKQHAFSADARHLVYLTETSFTGDLAVALSMTTGAQETLVEGPFSFESGAGKLLSFQLARGGRVFVHGAGRTQGVDELFLGVIGAPTLASDAPGNGGTIVR